MHGIELINLVFTRAEKNKDISQRLPVTGRIHFQILRIPCPTKYSIFLEMHLQPMSRTDVNAFSKRYVMLCLTRKYLDYELVKLYHPDSLEFRKKQPDHALRHAQFRAITAAYNKLQKGAEDAPTVSERLKAEQEALRRARRRRAFSEPVISDERWKDRLIIGSACLVIILLLLKIYFANGHHRSLRHLRLSCTNTLLFARRECEKQ